MRPPAAGQTPLRHAIQLEHALAFLHGVADAAARAEAPVEAEREVCRMAVERGGLAMAWYGRVDVRTGVVVPRAHAGHEQGYLLQAGITTVTGARGNGPTGRALRDRRPVVCNDIESDPTFAPWRAAALARGYRSSASIPVIVDDGPVGALNVYSEEPGHFTPMVVRTLVSAAEVLALAERGR